MDNNSQLELAYNWNFARDFPSLEKSTIDRPNFLETIVDILTPENPVVFLEGEEGDGATTTLAQFCKKYPDQTFSLFIKPASRFAYSLDYLRLALAEQFHWYIYAKALDKPFLDVSEFETLVHQVRRKKKAATLYFVVDGLHQIPIEDNRIVEQIIRDVLPIGVDNFRFIISGQQTLLGKHISKVGTKPYQQLKFRPEDTNTYLSGLGLSETDISEIHKVCKGVPGRIASVKRLLLGKTELQAILESEPARYLEFIRLEFNVLETLIPKQKMALAIIAFAKRTITSKELCAIAQIEEAEIAEIYTKCSFIGLNKTNDVIEYVSESHRRHAEKRLENLQKDALSLQVTYLLLNPSSAAAIRFLPTYYQQLNQQQALIDLLSADHYSMLLEETQSLASLRNRAELGAKSASLLKQATDVFKFSLQKSIFIAVASQDSLESEVAALVALNQPHRALTLANSAAAKEDRLTLLATYAKRIKEKNGKVDPELIEFIKELAEQIEFADNPDKAVEIAADILIFDPDLAVTIVEQANKLATKPHKLDTAYTQLSLAASLSKIPNKVSVEDKARQRISDAALQKLAGSFATLVESLSPEEVIKNVDQMEPGHRIYFLKWYTSFRRDQEHILDVIEYALDLMIKETAYTPKSKDFAELAIPLPHATKDKERLEKVIARFDSQIGLVAKSAYSKDIIVLQMRLAHAELSFDGKRTVERIEQAYYDVLEIKTPEVQSECCALMLQMLRAIDKEDVLEKSYSFRGIIKSELTVLLDKILCNTADHFSVVSGALRALAEDDCEAAFDLASRLNTIDRRDEAYSTLIKVVAGHGFSDQRSSIIEKSVTKICSLKLRSDTIRLVIAIIERNKDKSQWLDFVSKLFVYIDAPEIECECIIAQLRIQADTRQQPNINEFENKFATLVARIDSKLAVLDLYFNAVETLAKIDYEIAEKYYEQGRQVRQEINPNSRASLHILDLCISLISRAYRPIIKAGLLSDEMLIRFSNVVDMIPCSLTRAKIYSDLASRAWCVKRVDICKRIIQEKCTPLLEEAKHKDTHLYRQLIEVIFPSSRAAHSASAFALLDSLPPTEADETLYQAAMLILRRLPINEPYMTEDFDRSKLESEDAFDLLEILERTVSDSAFYWILEGTVQAICNKSNKTTFTAQQKAHYATQMQTMVAKKLPDKNNIQHDGYKISALAQTYRLIETPYKNWEGLVKEAGSISNIADRGYVFLALARCLPTKYDALRKKLLEEALALFDSIPAPLDRLSHYQSYADTAYKDSATSAKESLRRAIILSTEIETTARVERHQRQLIDIADRIDSALANELIELIDDDPARARAKAELKRSAAIAKTKREIANVRVVKDIGPCNPDLLPDAAWKNVAALLAGRLETKSVEIMSEYVMSANSSSLTDAYPVLSWYIENLNQKSYNAREVGEQVLPICEALLLSTEIAVSVMTQATKQKSNAPSIASLEESREGLMVRPKDRANALKFLSNWLRANAVEYIKFSDPYFGPDDLPFLRLVLSECPECKVYVLTSKQGLKKKDALSVDIFQEHWSRLIDQDPPETEILAISSDGDEKGLIHDRWIISKGSGLRIGTSFNSLGEGKLSEISEMEPAQASICEHHLNKFLDKQRLIDGQRVSYLSFTL